MLGTSHLDTEKEEERALLQLVAKGDERAFTTIIKNYAQVIYPYLLYWLKSPRLAEEVAQDVFMRIWKIRHKLPDISNFSGYVYVIARNRVNSQLSQLQSELIGAEEQDITHIDQILNNPHTALELKELAQIMDEAIETLPPRRREIFLLSRMEQLTYEEIAEKLGLSRSTVREHMVKALVYLRTYLKRNGGVIISILLGLMTLI